MDDSRLQPIALTSITLPFFIQRILDNHTTPTNLIVGSSEADFLQDLHASTEYEKAQQAHEAEAEGLDPAKAQRIASRTHPLAVPAIYQISTSKTVAVIFCETLARLQAQLAVHGIRKTERIEDKDNREGKDPPTLALLNAVHLHRGTSSFSVQGLSRTLASAVEAAHRSRQKLVLLEYPSHVPSITDQDMDAESGDEDMLDTVEDQGKHIWEEELAILNVATKSFGAESIPRPRLIRDPSTAGQQNEINAECLEILEIESNGVITTSCLQGWTYWDFSQSNGRTIRVVVIAVDGAYITETPIYPARAYIGVWFGNGTADLGSRYNLCEEISSRARHSKEAEVIAATEGLLRLCSIYSSGAWVDGLSVIVKTDDMGLARIMNTFIRVGEAPTSRHKAIRPELWDHLQQTVARVQSIGIDVAFWHVFREDNEYADALAAHARRNLSRPFRLATIFDTRPGICRDENGLISIVEHRRSPLNKFVVQLAKARRHQAPEEIDKAISPEYRCLYMKKKRDYHRTQSVEPWRNIAVSQA
ncbi:hypothetical protein FKW77_005752 [Venturia effusa]|uniref:Uncharacterized protein n=1 Tax=Venturia effusa TaxID=50376 RepID=A0A517LCE7_9PEZI|nr:hypothetical protein FKW77_005752 [Venturia effusa]